MEAAERAQPIRIIASHPTVLEVHRTRPHGRCGERSQVESIRERKAEPSVLRCVRVCVCMCSDPGG